MVLVEVIILAVILLPLAYFRFNRSQLYWTKKNVPHLPPTSFWGNMRNLFVTKKGMKYDIKNGYDELKRLGRKHGGIYLLTRPVYLVVDPEVIKKVLSKDFQFFSSRGMMHDEEKDPLTGHLFHLEGERWKNMRVTLTPTFTSGKMKLMFNTLLDCGVPMLERIKQLCEELKSLDIKEILGCYTTDVIGTCAFGLECNSFVDPDAEFRKFGRKIFQPSRRSIITHFLAFVFPKIVKNLYVKSMPQDIEDFFISAIKNVIDYRTANNVKRNDFVQILLEMQEKLVAEGKNPLSLKQIAAQSFVFFAAGFETTSITMTFCLHELAFNQHIQQKVRDEIREAMEKTNGKLTYDGVIGMTYMDQVVNEALRKYPPAPLLFRKCNAEYNFLDTNTTLDPGTTVFISTLGLHMDEEYFPDPEKFIPERFSDENKHRRPQYAFLPFGEGPRICIGARFALMQVKTGLSMILNRYRILPGPRETYKIELDPKAMMLTKKGKLMLNAEELKENTM